MGRFSKYVFLASFAAFLVAFVAVNWPDVSRWIGEQANGPWLCERCRVKSVMRSASGELRCIRCELQDALERQP